MPTLSVRFPGSLGADLAARLDMPALPPRAFALFAHCFTCSKDSKAATFVSSALAEQGIAVLRFDFTGLGASEGDFSDTGFSSNVADLVAAADWLRGNHGAPAILIGHSLGGAAVLAAAGRIAEVRAVATIGAPYEPAHVKGLLKSSVEEIAAKGEAEVELAGRRFRIRRDFLEDLDAQSQRKAIAGLRRALLVMHSPVDDTVAIDNATGIFAAAKHPKSFVSLDTADHLSPAGKTRAMPPRFSPHGPRATCPWPTRTALPGRREKWSSPKLARAALPRRSPRRAMRCARTSRNQPAASDPRRDPTICSWQVWAHAPR